MNKKGLYLIFLMAFFPLFSQDAKIITEILEKKEATYMDFSYLIASEMELGISPFEAYTWCDRSEVFGFTKKPSEPLTAKTFSYFVMKNYGLKGGIMWTIFKTPRYAWKELKNNGFWKPGVASSKILSGRDLVVYTSKFFTEYPEAQFTSVNQESIEPSLIDALLGNQGE